MEDNDQIIDELVKIYLSQVDESKIDIFLIVSQIKLLDDVKEMFYNLKPLRISKVKYEKWQNIIQGFDDKIFHLYDELSHSMDDYCKLRGVNSRL